MGECLSALERAADFYTSKGGDFKKAMSYHLMYGSVYSDFDTFGMIRPCIESEPFKHVTASDANAWYVEFAFGKHSLRKMISIIRAIDPSVKRFGFSRTNKESDIRFFDIEKFMRKV